MFVIGLVIFGLASRFNWKTSTRLLVALAVSIPSTLYSVILYLDLIPTDIIILQTLKYIFPIVMQRGPEIMFHTNATHATKQMISPVLVGIFYVLYFVWFYVGYKSAENLTRSEGTARKTLFGVDLNVTGLYVFVLGCLLMLYGLVIPTTSPPAVQFIFDVVGIYTILIGVYLSTFPR